MNTETPTDLQAESLSEPTKGAALTGIAVVLAVVFGALGLWFMQDDSAAQIEPVHTPDTKYDRLAIAETGPYPTADVDERAHHFGSMEFGDVGSHSYVVTNNGESELMLKEGPKSCACTRYEIESKSLAPGETTKIFVEWDPKKPEVIFNQAMNLYTNDPENQVIPLTVSGTVAAVVQVVPKGEWDVGVMTATKDGKIAGVVASALLETFELAEITTSHPQLKFELIEAKKKDLKSLKANHGIELHLTLGTAIPAGPFRGTVKFKVEGRPDREYTINVKAHRDGSIKFFPTEDMIWDKRRELVDLGQFKGAEGKVGRMMLYLDGDKELTVNDVSTSLPFLQCTLEKDPTFRSDKKKRYILTFEVPPNSPTGSKRSTVSIKTDHPEYPDIKMRVRFLSMTAAHK